MAITTIKASNRYYKVTKGTGSLPGAPFLEIGTAGTQTSVSTWVVQFKPDNLFDGQFAVVGHSMGKAADDANMPFIPIPYRRVNVSNVASDYALVSDVISGTALIQIPANGMTVALEFVAPTQGQCEIVMWDLQGSSAV